MAEPGKLHLTRKIGEAVLCSKNGELLMTVKVLGILPNEVRLLFVADRSIAFKRDNAINWREDNGKDDKADVDGNTY